MFPPSLRIALSLSLLSQLPVYADSAWISAGGNAHQMNENTTVSMQSELVRIHVGTRTIKVDCRFVFVNNGPACTVRMGFPDSVTMAFSNPRKKRGSFLSFKSYVDDKKVTTELVNGEDTSADVTLWHANDVSFPANGTRIIRDVYCQTPGIAVLSDKGDAVKVFTYFLHTASSWHGNIQRGDIYVTFDKGVLPAPIKVFSTDPLTTSDDDAHSGWWIRAARNTLEYDSCLKAPSVEGQTIHFEFTDLLPTRADDLSLFYNHLNKREAISYGGFVFVRNFLKQNVSLPTKANKRTAE
jgi:hypothetical protein